MSRTKRIDDIGPDSGASPMGPSKLRVFNGHRSGGQALLVSQHGQSVLPFAPFILSQSVMSAATAWVIDALASVG